MVEVFLSWLYPMFPLNLFLAAQLEVLEYTTLCFQEQEHTFKLAEDLLETMFHQTKRLHTETF